MTTREEIIQAALRYRNVPFRMTGRNLRGIDCIGIPLCIARDLAITGWKDIWADRDVQAYAKIRGVGYMRAKLDGYCARGLLRRLDREACRPGDMLLCRSGLRHDHHVAIFMPPCRILEARDQQEPGYPDGRVILEDMTRRRWNAVLRGYQFAEVD